MKLMKSFPGGTLLIPMLLSAIINTFFPRLFYIGGLTQALFTGNSLNFILGAAVFISGCSLNLSTINDVIKRYGILLLARLILTVIFGILFVKFFGIAGFLGLSSVAFISTLTSMNPTLFLAIMSDKGDAVDKASFSLIALFSSPVIPIFIYNLTSPTDINYMPMISIVIPLILGIIIGNCDKEFAKYLSTGMDFIIVMLGWSVGASINLLDAFSAGLSGIMMVILYYLLTTLPLLLIEKYILKRSGVSSIALSTIAGLSASIPLLLGHSHPEVQLYASRSAAITTLGVVITAVLAPILANKLYKNI